MVDIVKLDGGLRIVNEYMGDVESVSINVWVKTGSRNETKEQNGISHFLEHMAFKGTKTRNTQRIAEEFDDLGGRVNAFTSASKTGFYTKVLNEYVEKAVELLADIFQSSIFEETEIEKERKVILQEYAMILDDPTDLVFHHYNDSAYKNQPFGRAIIGAKKNIKSFNRSDIIKYIDEQYKSEDIVISFAGKFKIDDAVKLIKKYFNKIKNGKNNEPQRAIYTGGKSIKNKKLEQTQIVFGYEGITNTDDKFYRFNVLAVLLGGGISSRLFQEVREKRGLCYSIGAYNNSSHDTGDFCVYSAIAPDKVIETLDAIKEEMNKVIRKITQEEFNRALVKLKSNMVMGQENNTSRSQKNASNLLSRNRIISIEEIENNLNKIKIKDLQEDMEYITNQKSTLALLGKINDDIREKIEKLY
jgi:predicted Zn-dependent peptidase